MFFTYNLTTTYVTVLIFSVYEVVTLLKNKGYNPLTTAYNHKSTYNRFFIVTATNISIYKAVVGCKCFLKKILKK